MVVVCIVLYSFGQGIYVFSCGVNVVVDWMDMQIGKFGSKFFQVVESGENSWGLYVKEGFVCDCWMWLVVEVMLGLVWQLVGLMIIVMVWDLSGVVFNVVELDGNKCDGFKIVIQGINFVSDLVLLCLQVCEMVFCFIGKEVLKDFVFVVVFEQFGLCGVGVKVYVDGVKNGW